MWLCRRKKGEDSGAKYRREWFSDEKPKAGRPLWSDLGPETGEEPVRCHICFYGCVQGVGFRYQAMQAAVQLKLTGWVRNVEEYVEMEVQGPGRQIDRLIYELEENRWIRIERIESDQIPVKEEADFQITW